MKKEGGAGCPVYGAILDSTFLNSENTEMATLDSSQEIIQSPILALFRTRRHYDFISQGIMFSKGMRIE